MAKFILAVCFFLASTGGVWAQNDFPPFSPNLPPQPPWNINVPPYNQSSNNYQYFTMWGPYNIWEAKRGWTVEVYINVNWWPGPMSLSLMSPNAQNMRVVSGDMNSPAPCVPSGCTIRFEAGDDYPELQLAAWAPYRWYETNGGWAQVIQVIPLPEPPRSLYSQEEKANAAWWQSTIGNANNYIAFATASYCSVIRNWVCAAGAIVTAVGAALKDHNGTIAQDPWDDWYKYAAEPDLNLDPGRWGFWWTGDGETDNLLYAAMVVMAYAEAANPTINRVSTCISQNDDCQWWQQQRLSDMHWIMGYWTQTAAQHLSNVRDNAWYEGAYEMYDPMNNNVGVIWGTGDYLNYLAGGGQ